MRLSRGVRVMCSLLLRSSPGLVEPGTDPLGVGPAMYQIAMLPPATPDSRAGGSRTRCLVLPRHAGHRSPSARRCSLSCSDRCGIRTQPLRLERLTTSPEVERAIFSFSAYRDREWVGGRSRPPLRGGARVCGFSGHPDHRHHASHGAGRCPPPQLPTRNRFVPVPG